MAETSSTATTHSDEEVLFEGRSPLVPDLGTLLLVVISLGLWLIVRSFLRLDAHYRVTTRRVVVESGVFSKTLEQVDLYRIADYTVERPFGQRMLGTGNLLLKTSDKTTPELKLCKLKTDVVALYERIRVATEADRARLGVRVVDYEDHPGAR